MASEPPSYGRPRWSFGRGTNRIHQPLLPLERSGDQLMEMASGEVVDTPQGATPYCAIFRVEDEVLFRWPVQSVSEGHARIEEALTFLHMKILESRAEGAVLH